MKYIILFSAGLLFFIAPVAQEFKQYEEVLMQSMKEARTASGGICIIKNGTIAYKNSFGEIDITTKTRATTGTLYNVASVSKSLTAWGVMKLVENGNIRLDEPINNYLKRWKLPAFAGDNTEVTARMLLSHTAGLNMGPVPEYAPGKTLPLLPDALKDLKIIQRPGQGFRYSGGGYMLLQLMIEEVTGKNFSNYMKDEILVPLGMTGSTFDIPVGVNNVATPYDETLKAAPHYSYVGVSAAGLYTSIDDLSKFAIASLGMGPNPVLKMETLGLMKTKVGNTNYALGYSFEGPDSTIGFLGHSGAASGWRAAFYINGSGDGIVLVTNSSFNDFVNAGLCQWIQSVYNKETFYCEKSIYSSLVVDLFTRGQKYTLNRIEKIKKQTGKDPLPESTCNILGYWLMRLERLDGAKTFFEFNTKLYPGSANAFDSMGEFYERIGDIKNAVRSYRKVLALQPNHSHALQAIQKLEMK